MLLRLHLSWVEGAFVLQTSKYLSSLSDIFSTYKQKIKFLIKIKCLIKVTAFLMLGAVSLDLRDIFYPLLKIRK